MNNHAKHENPLAIKPTFESRLRNALNGNKFACWTLVWQCLHEFANLSMQQKRQLESAALKVLGAANINLGAHGVACQDNARMILAVLSFKGFGKQAHNVNYIVQSLAGIRNPSPQVYAILTLLHLQGSLNEGNPDYLNARTIYSRLQESLETELTQEEYKSIHSLIEQPDPSLNLEALLQYVRQFKYSVMQLVNINNLLDFGISHCNEYGVRYQVLKASEHFFANVNIPVVADFPNKHLRSLLNDELLSIEQKLEYLLRNNFNTHEDGLGLNVLDAESLLLLGEFLVEYAKYSLACEQEPTFIRYAKHILGYEVPAVMNPEIELVAGEAAPETLESILHGMPAAKLITVEQIINRLNHLGHREAVDTLAAKWQVARFDIDSPQHVYNINEFIAVTALQAYPNNVDAMIRLSRYLCTMNISNAFSDGEKADLISSLLYLPHCSLVEARRLSRHHNETITPFIATAPSIAAQPELRADPAHSPTQGGMEEVFNPADSPVVGRPGQVVNPACAALKREGLERLRIYVEFCKRGVVMEAQQPGIQLASPANALLKQPFLAALTAAQVEMRSVVEGFWQRKMRSTEEIKAREREAQGLSHLVRLCESVNVAHTLPVCARQMVKFLRQCTFLNRGTPAFCMMQKLAAQIDIDFAVLVAQEKDPVNIRNIFCAKFEDKYCGSSLVVGTANQSNPIKG
jgi:hypothetical protein